MKLNKLMRKANIFMEWVARFLYVNFLWFASMILGLGIFGFFPATVSLFAVMRQWIRKKKFPITKTFIYYFRKDFLPSNLIGYLLFIIAVILYLDFKFFMNISSFLSNIIVFFLVGLSIIYGIIVLYIFPVYVHFNLSKIQEYFKFAFIIGISHPLNLIKIILSFFLLYIALNYVQSIFVLINISIISFIIMLFTHNAFIKVEKDRKKINEK